MHTVLDEKEKEGHREEKPTLVAFLHFPPAQGMVLPTFSEILFLFADFL